jgi:hypothetical protein
VISFAIPSPLRCSIIMPYAVSTPPIIMGLVALLCWHFLRFFIAACSSHLASPQGEVVIATDAPSFPHQHPSTMLECHPSSLPRGSSPVIRFCSSCHMFFQILTFIDFITIQFIRTTYFPCPKPNISLDLPTSRSMKSALVERSSLFAMM